LNRVIWILLFAYGREQRAGYHPNGEKWHFRSLEIYERHSSRLVFVRLGRGFVGGLCSRRKNAHLFHGSSGRPLKKCHAIVKHFMLHCPKSARQCFQKLARSLDLREPFLWKFIFLAILCCFELWTRQCKYKLRCFRVKRR